MVAARKQQERLQTFWCSPTNRIDIRHRGSSDYNLLRDFNKITLGSASMDLSC